MIVTLDTNVIFQALYSSSGASYAILQQLRRNELTLALSHAVLLEYESVLTRPENLKIFEVTKSDVLTLLRFLSFVSEKYEPSFLFRPNLQDENDNIFVELAIVSQSSFLVTQNLKDFFSGELKFTSFETVSPADFMRNWRKHHG